MSRIGSLILVAFLALATLGMLPGDATAQQSGSSSEVLQAGTIALRQRADAGDAEGFMQVLDQVAPAIFNAPRLSQDDRFTLLGGIAVLARRMDDPAPYIEAESWIFVLAEAVYGPEAEFTSASRARLLNALMRAGRTDEAVELAETAPPGAEERRLLAPLMAKRLMDQERFAEAAEILEAELQRDILLSGPDRPGRYALVQLLARAQRSAGNPDRAVELLAPLYPWVMGTGLDPESRLPFAAEYGLALTDAGDAAKAKDVLLGAWQMAEATLGATHRTTLLLSLALSNAHAEAGEFWQYVELRLDHYDRLRAAQVAPIERATALEDEAELLQWIGRSDEVQKVLYELLALAAYAPEVDPLFAARALMNLGDLYARGLELDDARRSYLDAARIFETEAGVGDIRTLRARAAAAGLPVLSPDVTPEILAFREALERGDTDALENPDILAWGADYIERFYSGSSMYQRATDQASLDVLAQYADAEARATGPTSQQAMFARLTLAEHLADAGQADAALAAMDQGLEAFAEADEDMAALFGDGLFAARGEILEMLGRKTEALAAYDDGTILTGRARDWLERTISRPLRGDIEIDGNVGFDFARLALELARTSPKEEADALLARAFERVQIAGYGDASRALLRAEARNAREDPGTAAVIAQWEAAVAETRDAIRRGTDAAGPGSPRSRLDAAEAALREEAPDYFDRLAPAPLTLEELQRTILGEDEALVLIAPAPVGAATANPHGLVFAVSRDGAAWSEMPLSGRATARAIFRLHAQLDTQRPGMGLRAPVNPGAPQAAVAEALFDTDAAHELYDAIFGDAEVAKVLAAKDRWLIAPQGLAMTLPYAALVAEPTERPPETGADLREVRWLGLEKALTILPGPEGLRARTRTAAPQPREERLAYVGFGNPAFTGAAGAPLRGLDELLAEGAGRARAVSKLPRLPGTEAEVKRLNGLFGSEQSAIFLGDAASEETLFSLNASGRLQDLDVLHFATHGLLAGAVSSLSEPALALSPPKQGVTDAGSGWLEDGLLTSSEVARLRTSAEWIILSACDTSGSANIGANFDGLSGLVRAFLFAGARGLMVSHWRVEDDIAAALTIRTVENRLGGTGRDEALRRAMREIASDPSRDDGARPLSHPSVWAPFFLVGYSN